MPNLIIHIGMPKTGSTFLQSKVWPEIFNSNGFKDTEKGAYQKIDSFRKNKYDYVFISEERLSVINDPPYPGLAWDRFEEFVNTIEDLKQDVGIIFFIRKHDDWLWSGFLEKKRFITKMRTWPQTFKFTTKQHYVFNKLIIPCLWFDRSGVS